MRKSRPRRCVAQALVEFALVGPLLMGLTLGVLQVVLYAHARDVVISSVQEAARLSAEDGRGLEDGYARARALVDAGLGRSLEPLAIDGSMDSELVVIHLDATLQPIVPLLGGLPLHADASVARERFRPAGG
ncbi:MAG: pilus assembly protein [Chloroflexi bacterium]|nr:pilus assembly protein [Chloroflexota bacterium]